MKITKIEENKRYKGMHKVYIDDTYRFSIYKKDLKNTSIALGRTINEDEIDNIENVLNYNTAKEKAVVYLSLKYRTAYETKKRLCDIGYNEVIADKVISKLKSIGYINDNIYTSKYISDRLKLKPKSEKALTYELIKKGVDIEIIEEILEDYDINEDIIAFRLAKKRYGKYDIKDQKIQRRIYSYLGHRGFSMQTIRKVIDELADT